ncbi:MAG TPA: NHL repeat-containing protein [Solirubrobacterales bacterium]|nr:NHL repeat-containing protein [Solirubrobacterales bacterium]
MALVEVSGAWAANSFVPSGEITGGELTGPARIAVDPTSSDVLVVDTAKNRVDVYDSTGPGASLLTTFGESDLAGPYGIAIDPSNGDVYVTDPGNGVIRRYSTDGASPPTYSLDTGYAGPASGTGSEEVGSFLSAVAVDPTDGDLLVADRGNGRVERFDSTGAFVSSFDGSDSPGGAFTHLEDVTLSPAGKIFVADGEAATGGESRVLRFSNSGAFEATLRPKAATGDGYLAYDSKHTELIVGDARECFVCNVSIHVLDPSSGATLFEVAVPAEVLTGLASDPNSGRLYAAASRGEFFAPAKVEVLAPQTHPDLVLNPPGPITSFTAHLSGTVDPGGVATEYHFEISKDGGTSWQKSPEPDAGAGEGTAPVAVETDFAVEPNNHYIARLVAANAVGAQDATPTQSFDTGVEPPAVQTRPATDLTETSGVVNGTVNPFGLQTTYYFEYGPTSAYGSRIPAGNDAVAGQGHGEKSVNFTLFGLTPGATYHYRLVASNSAGTSVGSDQVFSTAGSQTLPTRSYEQVTPAVKQGRAVTQYFGMQASADGDALTYLMRAGPNAAPINVRFIGRRGSSDWSSIATDPPIAISTGNFLTNPTIAYSSDYEHALVVTNRALSPGAVEQGANLYKVDLETGQYHFIASTEEPKAFESFVVEGSAGVFAGAAPDLSWVVFWSFRKLLPNAPPNAMYRWSETGGLELISVLPDGDATETPKGNKSVPTQTMSRDGSRIYFTALHGSEEGVFLRENLGAAKPISVSDVAGEPTAPQPAVVLGTSEDGRYAFFAMPYDSAGPVVRLTADAPGEKGDLYRYDAVSEQLEYLGAPAFGQVQGGGFFNPYTEGAFGVSPDGDTLYFNRLENGQPVDFSVWRDGAIHSIPGPGDGSEQHMSPNGRYYAFYGVVGGVPHVVQRYDSATNQTTCISCLPDGTPVEARMTATQEGNLLISNRTNLTVDDQGTVYFDTIAAMVAADVNGTRDVYAWRAGQFELISPGNGDFRAEIGEVSPDGRNVFFTTSQKLVGRDDDNSVDIYDARIGGGLPAQDEVAEPGCLSSCKSAVSGSAEAPAAGSESVNGPGNVRQARHKKRHPRHVTCASGKRKVKVKGKAKCVKKNSRHHAAKNNRGGNR